ncbi:MAG: DNA primase [Clostridia bacterium]|nr:DNA primase [Clostridia bacterium]
MAIPEEVINEIKYRNEIESVIAPYVNLKRRGKNLVGLCPFHNEKTPSFTVYPENGSFYCFGCGVGGDVFSFTKLMENLDYIDAVKLLAERSGISLPEDSYDDSMQKMKSKILEINRETAKFFHQYLMTKQGKWALDYLSERGLALATIKHFGLGAAPDSWDSLINHLKSKGYTINDMIQANVVAKSSRGSFYDRFRKRIMFPVIDIRGNVIAFSGRAMPGEDKAGGKYVNTSDTLVYKKSENLFGMNFAKNFCADRIILVEGNMDVISLHQAGFENAVAALGTSFTENQAKLISRYTKEIVLTLDADAAGKKAVARAGEILKSTGISVRIITLPDCKDPDEYIKKHGKERFAAILEGAVSELEYKLLMAVGDIDVTADDGKLKYLAKAAEIIASNDDVMARDLYIGKLSDKYGVSRTAFQTKVDELRRKNVRTKEKREISAAIAPKYNPSDINPDKRLYPAAAAAEEAVIAILLQHPDFYEEASSKLSPDDMLTSLNRRIYAALLKLLEEGRAVDVSYFGEMLSSAELGFLVSLLNSEKGEKNALIVLKDSISVILGESFRKNSPDIKNMSDEDWAESMKKIIENKQKGKF